MCVGQGFRGHSRGVAEKMGDAPNLDAAIGEMANKLDQHYRLTFAESVRDACFSKCVGKPGERITNGERQCLDNCSQRYADFKELVAASISPVYEQIHGMKGQGAGGPLG